MFFLLRTICRNLLSYQGNKFGPKVLQKANDSNSRLFRYNSESKTNSDYIMLLKPDSDTAPSLEFAELFSTHFSRQGFSFKRQGNRMLGTGDKGVIYMIDRADLDVVFMLVVETKKDKPGSILDAQSIYYSLTDIKL